MKIGVLSNPLSRRNRKLHAKIEAMIALHPEVYHESLSEFASLPETLARFAAEQVELLVISGGDGTISGVLTEIIEHHAFSAMPQLAILPGGTSNTIANDVGLRGHPLKSLERLLNLSEAQLKQADCVSRAVLRIDYSDDDSPVHGLFFGTAAICDAIILRRRLFPQTWIPDPVAAALTLVRILCTQALGRAGVLSGQQIRIGFDAKCSTTNQYTIVFASTLKRIVLGSAPFWGEGRSTINITTIGAPATGLARHAYRLLYGRDRERLPKSTYQSVNTDRVELHMDCSFNVDGEFCQARKDRAVVLTAPATARFLQC